MHDDICISQYPSAISRYWLHIGWKLNFKKYINLLSKFNKKYDEIKDYCNSGKLSCRKHNLLTFSGSRQDVLAVSMFPAVLKTRSDRTFVAGMHKYFSSKMG